MMAISRSGKRYETKRDTWILLLLWAGVVIMVFASVNILDSPASLTIRLVLSCLLLATAAFILWLLYATYYTLTDNELVVRSGPFCWKIRLDSIREIFPTRNPLSSPACSLDRLHIRYQDSHYGIMISPSDKAAFLQDLASRSSYLTVEGDRVIREKVDNR